MSRYELYLFFHIAAVTIWIGAGVGLIVQAVRAERARDNAALKRIVDDAGALSKSLFVPASLATLVFGLLMVFDGPWEFEELWITLGLVGWLATLVTGLFVSMPRTKRLSKLMEEEGGMGPRSAVATRRLLTIARIDYVVLFLVVADMVIKPTGDDVGTLVLMAAILVAATAYFIWRARSIAAPAPAG